jgi:hypothetical protein
VARPRTGGAAGSNAACGAAKAGGWQLSTTALAT